MQTVMQPSDRRFLRCILFMLVISTIITGAIATTAAVMAGHDSPVPAHLVALGS